MPTSNLQIFALVLVGIALFILLIFLDRRRLALIWSVLFTIALGVGIAFASSTANATTEAETDGEIVVTISIREGTTNLCEVELGYDREGQQLLLAENLATPEAVKAICAK